MDNQCCTLFDNGHRCDKEAVYITAKDRYRFCEDCYKQWKDAGFIRAWLSPEARAETGSRHSAIMLKYGDGVTLIEPKKEKESTEEAPVEEDAEKSTGGGEVLGDGEGSENEGPDDAEAFVINEEVIRGTLDNNIDGVKVKIDIYENILKENPATFLELLKVLHKAEGKGQKRKGVGEYIKSKRG